MATILERLVVLFPSAELHVIHLAIDQCGSDLDSAIAQLIGWGCDFEPQGAGAEAAAATPPRPPPPRAAASAQRSTAAPVLPRHPSAALGRWTSQTITSWGHRPWLDL